jgi:hypothetical protein
MLGMLDMRGIQKNSQDVAMLRGYLQQLVGEPFLHVRFSYGDELTLHFGQPRKPQSKKLAHLSQGSYIVAARASSWYVKTASPASVVVATSAVPIGIPDGFNSLSTEQIESSNLVQPGACVVAADVIVVRSTETSGFACSLLMSDGASLLIVPESEADADGDASDDVADWEVFTPHGRYLRIGPGLKWSYLPSRGNQG